MKTKKVLCVCSANMLRSPTAQVVLGAPPYNFDTRSAGTLKGSVVPLTRALVEWADEIVCMEKRHKDWVLNRALNEDAAEKKTFVLDIPDTYDYRDPALAKLIAERYGERTGFKRPSFVEVGSE